MSQGDEDLLRLESVVRVPLQDDPNTVVEVGFDSASGGGDGKDVLSLLIREHAKPSVWFRTLMGYVRSHNLRGFEAIAEGFDLEGYSAEYENSDRESVEFSAVTSVCNALTMYYVSRAGAQAGGSSERERYQAKVRSLINATAERVTEGAEYSLATAWAYSLDTSTATFEGNLSAITDRYRTHPAALVGKGFLALKSGDKEGCRAALSYFRMALEGSAVVMRPEAATARYGIGLAAHRLGKHGLAAAALRRAVAAAEEAGFCHVEALCALAALEMTAGDAASALEHVRRAHAADPRDAAALNIIAEYHFFRGDVSASLGAALEALNEGGDDAVKAESNYIAGRAYHAQGNFEQALLCYNNAVSSAPHPLAQYGLGQINIHNGHYVNALSDFEKVLALVPASFEALRMAGLLAECVGRRDAALKYLKAALEQSPGDSTVLMHLAQLHAARAAEQSEAREGFRIAVVYYDRAIEAIRARGRSAPPPELLNNAAIIKQELGDTAKAEEYLRAAVDVVTAATGAPFEEYPPGVVTIAFNLARLYEATGRTAEARDIYEGIVAKHPAYVDCYIRLGAIARDAGHTDDAAKFFEKVLAERKGDTTATTYLASLYYERGDKVGYDKAFSLFQEIRSNFPESPYPHIAFGNYLYLTSTFRGKEKAVGYLREASKSFTKALEIDKHNKYAANGAGICLVEQGNYADYLNFAKSDTSSILTPEICVNTGHIFTSLKDYGKAAASYSKAIEHYKERSHSTTCISANSSSNGEAKEIVNTYVYLGMAHFLEKNYAECIAALQQALHMQPDAGLIWYNIALAQENSAVAALKAAKSSGYADEGSQKVAAATHDTLLGMDTTIANVTNAIAAATKAQETYEWILKTYKEGAFQHSLDFGIDRSVVREMARRHADWMKKAGLVGGLKEYLTKVSTNRQVVEAKIREEKERKETSERNKWTQEAHRREAEEERKKHELEIIRKTQEMFNEKYGMPAEAKQRDGFHPRKRNNNEDTSSSSSSSSDNDSAETPRKRIRRNSN